MSDQSLFLLSVEPETLCRQGFPINDSAVLDAMSALDQNEVFCNFPDTEDVQEYGAALQQSAFLHVVTETVFDYPHNSYGEKTWKPIVNLRPFVLVSVPNALQDLKSMGFETFDQWWDEGYDVIDDPLQRMKSIVEIVKWISSQSLHQLRMIYNEMKPILCHNYHHYHGQFQTRAFEEFQLHCQKNLLPR